MGKESILEFVRNLKERRRCEVTIATFVFGLLGCAGSFAMGAAIEMRRSSGNTGNCIVAGLCAIVIFCAVLTLYNEVRDTKLDESIMDMEGEEDKDKTDVLKGNL